MELQDWPVYVVYGLSFLSIGCFFLYHKNISNFLLGNCVGNSQFNFREGLKQENFMNQLKQNPREGDEELLREIKNYSKMHYRFASEPMSLPILSKIFSPIRYFRTKKEIKELKQRAQERLNSLEQIAA